jgi:hypothetical protein
VVVGEGLVENSSGTSHSMSISPLRNESQRGCVSSMIETSTRSITGRRFPLSCARISCPRASSAFGSASKYSSRKPGLRSNTIFDERFQNASFHGPVPTGWEPKSSP